MCIKKLYNKLFNKNKLGTSIPIDKVLICDLSHWQGDVDFKKLKSKGVKAVILKINDSVGTTLNQFFYDAKCALYYDAAKKEGLLVTGYSWLKPTADPIGLANHLIAWTKTRPLDFVPFLDFEDNSATNKMTYLNKAKQWVAYMLGHYKRKPGFYSSPGVLGGYYPADLQYLADNTELWVAHYIARSYPTVPAPWKDYTIWQTNDKGHVPYLIWEERNIGRGREFGVSSSGLDINLYKGDYQSLLNFRLTANVMPPEPVQPPKPTPTVLYKAKCTATLGLKVRKGPGLNYTQIRSLKYNDIVDVYEERAGWLKISPTSEEWCSKDYLVRISIPTPPTNNGEGLFKAKCIAHALTILPDPKPGGHIIGYLVTNDVRNVYEVKNNYYKIEKDRNSWVNGKYMEKL